VLARPYVERVRPDLVVLSASALVVGVMCLVFGAALNPAAEGSGATSAVRVATDQSERWLAMAVLWFCASVALTAGMPAILSLFQTRAHRLGTLAVVVLSVGAIGTSGFAMLLVFVQALARHGAFKVAGLETVVNDTGLAVFLWIWVTGFYLGSLLVAVALLVSHATHVWVPILLVLFVVLLPLGDVAGVVGQVIQLMALALAFTGIAVTAVSRTQEDAELGSRP
jgi:hypothetical protein